MKKIVLLLTLCATTPFQARIDCTGNHYHDEDGILRNNEKKDMTFPSYSECCCPCTGEWTTSGMCKACRHKKKFHEKYIIIKKSTSDTDDNMSDDQDDDDDTDEQDND